MAAPSYSSLIFAEKRRKVPKKKKGDKVYFSFNKMARKYITGKSAPVKADRRLRFVFDFVSLFSFFMATQKEDLPSRFRAPLGVSWAHTWRALVRPQ
jgi:hypothetical protein